MHPNGLREPVRLRVTALFVLCLLLAGAVGLRAAHLQILTNPRLENMARRQFQSKMLISPRRGLILDRNGEPLAVNMEVNSLAANPNKIQNKKTIAHLLSRATGQPYAKVLQRLSEKREFLWIKRHITDAELGAYRRWGLINPEGDLAQGLWLIKENKRIYPHNELAAQTLGTVNIDSEGAEGVELWQNQVLQGKVTSVSAVRDAFGRPAFLDPVAAKHVQDGAPVSLTIDASLQYEVEHLLRASIAKTGARSGTVIVMNSVTGELLALASDPGFNPNDKNASQDRRRNRALTDGYEPGSTLKAVLVASALSNGWSPSDQVWGERGSFKVQGKKISEAEAHEKFEWLSLKKMIQVSSNVGAAKVALKLGADKYLATLKQFGFATRTGTGFPGEIVGKIPARREWQPLTLANVGFGQGLLVTPMQMIRAYAVFANGGWLVEPTLLRAAGDTPEKPRTPKRVLTAKVVDQMTSILEGVTADGGTGLKARVPGYAIAGKTGTAQLVDPGTRRYARNRHIASFIGYPVGVDPRIVVLTLLDSPRGVYYASETAAPLFRDVVAAVANRFSLPITQPLLAEKTKTAPAPSVPQPDRILSSQAKPVAAPLPESAQVMSIQGLTATGAPVWKLPVLHGLTAREAAERIKGHKINLEIVGTGIITAQSPEAGREIIDGGTLRLMLSEP